MNSIIEYIAKILFDPIPFYNENNNAIKYYITQQLTLIEITILR